MGFVAGAITFIVTFASGGIVDVVLNCVKSVSVNVITASADGKKITVKNFIGYVYDAYTDEMGWSFLNKAFEKGLISAILDEFGGKLKDEFFDLIEENV